MSGPVTPGEPMPDETSRRRLLAGLGAAAGGGLLALAGTPDAAASVSDASYYSYGPIRYVDTRSNSGGRLVGGQTRTLSIFSGLQSYTFAVNLTVVDTKSSGYLALYNADLATRPEPYASISWQGAGRLVSNFALIDLGSAGLSVYCSSGATTSTHLIIDVLGYFYTGGAARPAPPGFDAWERRAQRQLRGDSD